jgi:hypothetical protein
MLLHTLVFSNSIINAITHNGSSKFNYLSGMSIKLFEVTSVFNQAHHTRIYIVEVQLHTFTTLAIDTNDRSASCIGHFISERITPPPNMKMRGLKCPSGRLVNTKASYQERKKKIRFVCVGGYQSEHYVHWAISLSTMFTELCPKINVTMFCW